MLIGDTVFLRLYFDNTAFQNRLHKEIIDKTYPMLSQSRQEREQAADDELEDSVPYDFGFEYRRLSVLKSDCEYFLGAGGRHEKHLSEGGSIAKQITRMRELYDLVPEKPEWLTAEDIDRYEAQMTGGEPEQSPLSAQYDENHDAVEELISKVRNELSEKKVRQTFDKDGKAMEPAPDALPELPAAQTVNPVTLYKEAVEILDRAVKTSSLYNYLRDRNLDYNDTKDKLNADLSQRVEQAAVGYPAIIAAYQNPPKFREWLIEDILECNYQDAAAPDLQDALERYADSPDASDWARGAPIVDNLEPEQAVADTEIPPEVIPEPADVGTPEQEEAAEIAESNLTPNVEEYLNLKAQYPDKFIRVQVGNYTLFYGKDAEAAAPALGVKLLEHEIPGLGTTSVTGSQFGWPSVLKNLREHGKNVVLARSGTKLGPDAPYEIIKEREAADYIPLGMELTIDGRRMKIDSVDYNTGNVSLLDLDMKGWFPIFRSESISFVLYPKPSAPVSYTRTAKHYHRRNIDEMKIINPSEHILYEPLMGFFVDFNQGTFTIFKFDSYHIDTCSFCCHPG